MSLMHIWTQLVNVAGTTINRQKQSLIASGWFLFGVKNVYHKFNSCEFLMQSRFHSNLSLQ